MSLINTLENKFGRFAIPGLVNILAGFLVVVWLLVLLQPEFQSWLVLNRNAVLGGQVWRLVTWMFVPGTIAPIWMLLTVMVMMTIGGALEQAWGAFRLNLYVLGGVVSVIVGAMVFGFQPEGLALYTTLFLAFAMMFPNFEFMLFFILPVKVKWLGLITGGLLLLNFIDTPASRLPTFFSLLNFFVTFGPSFFKGMKHKAIVTERRSRFESAKLPEGTFFHKCDTCGTTDIDDPKLEFRVTADGGEYCVTCLAKKEASAESPASPV